MRLKDKVSSRCSTDKFVRAPFLIHCALNNDECATSSRFPFTNARWRVRVRLTLMPVQPANAVCSGHRHAITGFPASLSACLSLPRARGGRHRLSNGFRAFQPFRLADGFRRGVRRGKMVGRFLAATRLAGANARYHSRSPFGFRGREASPRPGHDIKPGVTEPLHSFAQGLRRLRPSLGLARHGSARARD
jgi:hypothetical protein